MIVVIIASSSPYHRIGLVNLRRAHHSSKANHTHRDLGTDTTLIDDAA